MAEMPLSRLVSGGLMAKFSAQQRGFTLIEMSIVLIIIGLIIGGILKGQELIESSRQKNIQSQVDAIRSAVNSFQDRFKAIPGDYSSAVTNINALASNGNGNGLINAYATGDVLAEMIGIIGTTASENLNFFNHLVGAGLLGGASLVDGTAAAAGFSGGGVVSPLPSAAYPQSGMTAVYGTHQGQTTNGTPITGIWLRVHTFNAAAMTNANAVISPQRAFQLDTKFDETTPGLGRIRTDFQTTDAGACGGLAANTYAPLNTVRNCILYFALE